MTNTNGNPNSILEAERDALAHQNETPPPYTVGAPTVAASNTQPPAPPEPPNEPEPPAAEKPKELALFSAEWFEANIAGHEMMLRQNYAAMCATREYAAWQAEFGALENMKAQRDLLLQQAAQNSQEK